MKSEDDPEARIRELEQPLAEAARASEAGANPPPSKWAPPPASSMPPPPGAAFPPGPPMPTPPSLPYSGGLFPSPSAQYSRSNRTLWIILGVFVIGMIALPAAIFLFTAHQVSRSGITTFSPIPSIPTVGPTPSAATTASLAPTPQTSVSTAPAGQNITVSGINEARTIACNGGSVSVSGITNNVVITGHCASVTVSGIQNQITVDAADMIQASGSGNQVTYHSGSPKIDNSGFGNNVQRR
ncbi:MAG TPA: DUF3060 domain-containing protein [Mycobacterium sp.]|uniref:DUF3060 domain-containing protein n=1 Tax=Mycobacterium sp. TaxID=1785 RepID=UPI002B92B3AC|nr:DUF3060 domain-containing protein [Mycobacterium sp.]HXO81626.1 DUF3060 domain-containing protein [Mycobacterium sp.]